MSPCRGLLDEQGALARKVPGFAPRAEQQAMAEAVAETLAEKGVLVVEAGTGTGKTYAYLVPALLSGLRVIISTGTRHLQDQLFHRDLPVVRDALEVSVPVALLKGRANYLCLHRLDMAEEEGASRGRRQLADLQHIRSWAGRTSSGDIAEVSGVGEDSPLWPRVTSTPDNCLGQDCGYFSDCHVVKARRAAQEASVLVINHHLLFADLSLKEEGFGELLPEADALILDEAHQLPEVASQFFGQSLGSRQLQELARDAELEHLKEAGDMQDLPDAARQLIRSAQDARLAMGRDSHRGAWAEIIKRPGVKDAFSAVAAALEELNGWLETAAERGRGLESCWRRGLLLRERLTLTTENPPQDSIHWYETYTRSFSLNLTPMDIAGIFRERMQGLNCAWVYTSATLAVGKSFDHFTHRLGLEDPRTLQLDSPFDYPSNALCYMPASMPDPNAPHYTEAVIAIAQQVLRASQGRAFLLFTSYRAMHAAAESLEHTIDYPLLVQGSAPRSELLEQFRTLGNAVLLGTSSFWEGVDVRGEALSCVIIDKLPFASPGDPVLKARIDALRAGGGNPFMEYQLPVAVIALKQGIGRLIRDVNDRGVLVLCDPRLYNKPYGRLFLASLPAMPRSRDLQDVETFFANTPAPPTTTEVLET